MLSQTNCPLCGLDGAQYRDRDVSRGTFEFVCRACGTFVITEEGHDAIRDDARTKHLHHLISAATRHASDSGQPLMLTSENWRNHADAFQGVSVPTKLRNLLEALRKKSTFYGHEVDFKGDTDWPLLVANGPAECLMILQTALVQNLVARKQRAGQWSLTWEGWQAVEPISGGIPGLGFVAMAFKPEFDSPYENGILPALRDCGFRAIRTDKEHFSEKICDRIIVEIRRAQFVIADFTLQRGGVYFEAGYALALGRPLIWSCREDDTGNLHFDTRQYPYIIWREAGDLRIQIRDRLCALIPGALMG